MKTMTDPRCGKVSRANDQDGHCCSCHLTWVGESAFTAHQHLVDGNLVCDDPETTTKPNGDRKFYPRTRLGTSDGVAWGLGPPLGPNGAPWWDSSPNEGTPSDSEPQRTDVVDLVGRLREAVDAARIRRTTPRIPGGEG